MKVVTEAKPLMQLMYLVSYHDNLHNFAILLAKLPKLHANYEQKGNGYDSGYEAMSGAYDPRAIANLMLDEADRRGIIITNLVLQKLLYFAHGIFLTKTKKPLVSGYFEAWQYGPVHPSVYRAFKPAGAAPITSRAFGQDPLTGSKRKLPLPTDIAVVDLVSDVMRSYGPLSPGRLVDLSHADKSPWSYVVDKARTDVAFGMRIPDNVIMSRFQHHKVSVDAIPRAGEPPSDDTPFA